MSRLIQTERALAEFAGNRPLGYGGHLETNPAAGVFGLPVGNVPFDAARHSVAHIDHFSPLGLAMGEDYVREVLPYRPMSVNLVLDYSARSEHQAITKAKELLMDDIATAIEYSMPHMTDQVQSFRLGSSASDHGYSSRAMELPAEQKTEEIEESIAGLAIRGLTIVISDFERFSFAGRNGDLGMMVAVKVNHPMEMSLPAGIGRVSLGQWNEVNTNSSRQLKAANTRLSTHHEAIVRNLETGGAAVAQVISTPKSIMGYDVQAADGSLSSAVESVKQT
jgi:hypothetical protein